MRPLAERRKSEQEKYVRVYQQSEYRMGVLRAMDTVRDLKCLPMRGSLVDVGCGRGEMLEEARAMGFGPVIGVEVVPELVNGTTVVSGEVHALPFADKSYDVATMWDVIEHLVPGDDEAACRELARVARRHVMITANNLDSKSLGVQLHINKRPYEEWDRLFKTWFAGATVEWLKAPRQHYSQGWRIDL